MENQETLDAIVAEMRRRMKSYYYSRDGRNLMRQYADRIEAAAKRERKLLKACARWILTHDIYGHMAKELLTECKKVLCDDGQFKEDEMQKPVPARNLAAICEALAEIKDRAIDVIDDDDGTYRKIAELALAALNKPARNCDLYGGDYKMLHTAWFDWTGSPYGCDSDGTVKMLFGEWLLAPAIKKGGAV